jgi:hypothetical protein
MMRQAGPEHIEYLKREAEMMQNRGRVVYKMKPEVTDEPAEQSFPPVESTPPTPPTPPADKKKI